jgi:photosystem II stability/assembly factor-like uncharacterized protein
MKYVVIIILSSWSLLIIGAEGCKTTTPEEPMIPPVRVLTPVEVSGFAFGSIENGYCTSSSAIYRTTDDGSNWRKLAIGKYDGIDITRIDAMDSNGYFFTIAFSFPSCGTEGCYGSDWSGILRSVDEGLNWTLVSPTPSGSFRSYTRLWVHSHNLYCAGLNGIFRSTDAGNSWVRLGPGVSQNIFGVDNNERLYAERGDSAISSTDYGVTWTTVWRSQPLTITGFVATDNGDIFVYTCCKPYVWRSTNGGTSWTKVLYLDLGSSFTGLQRSANGFIFASSHIGLFRSSDEGVNWSKANYGLTDTSLSVLAVTPHGPILVATKIGVFRSSNSGDEWFEANNGLTDTTWVRQ